MVGKYFQSYLDKRGLTEDQFCALFNYEGGIIAGTDDACELLHSLDKAAPIALMTDYDVDGLMCGVIGYAGLHLLGFTGMYLLRRDISAGYEFTEADIDAAGSPELLITADVGISCYKALLYARDKGIKTLVTDHHVPVQGGCPADAVVDFLMDKAYRSGNAAVCGAYTLWQLLDRYLELYRDEYPAGSYQDIRGDMDLLRHFAGVSTLSDAMPLTGHNHDVVSSMLKFFNYICPLSGADGIVSGVCRDGVVQNVYNNWHTFVLQFQDSHYVGFTQRFLEYSLIPAMNSVRRMCADPSIVYTMFFGTSEQAAECAETLAEMNEERKEMVAEFLQELLDSDQDGQVFFTEAPAGVLGLLATRMVEAIGLPCCVLNKTPEFDEVTMEWCYSGSARSLPWYPFLSQANSSGYASCAGHETACGITVPCDKVKSLREFLAHDTESMRPITPEGGSLTADNVSEKFDVVMDFDADMLTFTEDVEAFMQDMKRMGPFGPGLPEPKLLLRFHQSNGALRLLKEGKHVKITLVSPGEGAPAGMPSFQILLWNTSIERLQATSEDGYVYLTGQLSTSYFMGNRFIDFVASPVFENGAA